MLMRHQTSRPGEDIIPWERFWWLSWWGCDKCSKTLYPLPTAWTTYHPCLNDVNNCNHTYGATTYWLHIHGENNGLQQTTENCTSYGGDWSLYPWCHGICGKSDGQYISIFGALTKILSDREASYASGLVTKLCVLFDVKKLWTTPYHVQCNGQVERFHQTLVRMIGKLKKLRRITGWNIWLMWSKPTMTHILQLQATAHTSLCSANDLGFLLISTSLF